MKFHRLEPADGGDPAAVIGTPMLTDPSFVTTLVRCDGIVVASWDESRDLGRVHALGMVTDVDKARGIATVDWRRANFTVNPSPQGRTQWITRPYFKFAEGPASRYRLREYFADTFESPAEAAPVVAAEQRVVPPLQRETVVQERLSTVSGPVTARQHPPRRNRVAPNGELIVTAARGTFMGNRAYGVRWLICELEFERDLKEPRKYEKLFFLDEAVALAAGHRPCTTCRRGRLESYIAAVRRSVDIGGAAALDAALNAARVGVRWRVSPGTLPDGTFVTLGPNDFRLMWKGALHRWTPDGYADSLRVGDVGDGVTVLTPAPSVEALRHGYEVEVHQSVGSP